MPTPDGPGGDRPQDDTTHCDWCLAEGLPRDVVDQVSYQPMFLCHDCIAAGPDAGRDGINAPGRDGR